MFKDRIRLKDVIDTTKFALAWPISLVLRGKHPNLWLISERSGEARDNGFALFEYIRNNNPDYDVRYVISRDGVDYSKVEKYGNILINESFLHYIYYWLATGHASAHVDAGTPNSRITNFLNRVHIMKGKRIFLQHGVVKDILPFCFYENTKADYICCHSKIEANFVEKYFGYPKGNVVQTGMARFDKLWREKTQTENAILVMPTWRSWLAPKEYKTKEMAMDAFIKSQYYQSYSDLLDNIRLQNFLNEREVKLYFYLHSDMQAYTKLFHSDNTKIIIASSNQYDIQRLLIKSKVLITDYSSVFFDFAFMDKPTCFFHFDYEEYRMRQHPEGYYDYHHGFGPVFETSENLIEYLDHLLEQNCKIDMQYQEYKDNFFDLKDGKNCERIFELMKK